MKPRYVILLTACVNPGGMPFTVLNDKSERLRQYREALDFYLRETTLPIVFCENTLFDFSEDYKEYIAAGRLEYITFDGNNFDKSKGKGYGEALIMEEAFRLSNLLGQCYFVVKITGRLIVRNISQLVKDNRIMITDTIQTFYPHDNMIDSRLVILPKLFCINDFLAKKKSINDTQGYFFEHLLYDTIISRKKYVFVPFLHVPLIDGMSGSTGNLYNSDSAQYNHDRFAFDMLGNALKMERFYENYHTPTFIRCSIYIVRLVLFVKSK
ncbi:MAG: hypothetical protein ACI37N_06480 [Prevotella sp.]